MATITGLSADLLVSIAQARTRQFAAPNTATSTAAAIKAPWETTTGLTSANTLVSNALSGKAVFDASTKTFSTPGLSADARKLFALHAGINTLSALAGRYDAKGVSDGEKARLEKAFAAGMKQLDAFLAGAKFDGIDVVRGALMAQSISKASVGTEPREYTTGIVARGDPSVESAAFAGNLAFSIDAEDSEGNPKHIDIDLADMGATPHSLNSVTAFLNQKLTAAGLTSKFTVEDTKTKASNGDAQFALKLKMTTGEGFSFSAAATSPALYVVGGQNTLIKFQDTDGGAAPVPLQGDPNWTPGQVFNEPLSQASAIGTVRATTTGPDGAVYVLADVTSSPEGQPIKGASDVALFKYDSAGHQLYSRVIGAAQEGAGYALAVSADGRVAVGGSVVGALGDGASDKTANDSFVTLYGEDGAAAWTARDKISANDEVRALAFGADGTLYVGGRTEGTMNGTTAQGGYDAYLRAYDDDGKLRSTTQFGGTGDDSVQAIAVEDLGGGAQRVTLADAENGKLVLRQFADDGADITAGTTRDLGALVGGAVKGIAIDGNDLYIAGNAGSGGLSAGAVALAYTGGQDGFVARLSTDLTAGAGDQISYIGGAGDDTIAGIAAVGGQVWLAGDSKAAFNGQTAIGDRDGFIARLESDGTFGFTRRFSEKDRDFTTAGFAFDPIGSTALDRFGLPSGTLGFKDTDLITSRTALKAGDQFSLSVNGRSKQTITIKADDTMQTLADRVERLLLSSGAATKTTIDDGVGLKIVASNGVKITLSSGPDGKDALKALGMDEGVIANKPTTDAAKKKALPSYGLGISTDVTLSSKLDRKVVSDEFGAALSTIQNAYKTLTQPKMAAITGKAPEYLQAQLANYQAALARLTGGS